MKRNTQLAIGGIIAAFLIGGSGFALGHWTGHMHGAELAGHSHAAKDQTQRTMSTLPKAAEHSQSNKGHSHGAADHSHGNEKSVVNDHKSNN